MCLRPKAWFDRDGNSITIACQECRQCLDLKTHLWIGRNIAESRTSTNAHMVTLTYGRDEFGNEDHPRAKVLTYSDPQKWFKLLRYHGYPCRYFLSGEYGPSKGRTHWHFIVYWLGPVPPFAGYDMNGRWSIDHVSRGMEKTKFMHHRVNEDGTPAMHRGRPSLWWPHGWTQVSEGATPESIAYVCKYIRKDITGLKKSQFMMSKDPPIGAAYFALRAERYVALQLAPQAGMGYQDGKLEHGMGGYSYTFPEATYVDKTGAVKQREFQLRGRSLEMFLEHYIAAWSVAWPDMPMPRSKLLEDFIDPGAWKPLADALRPLRMAPGRPVTQQEKDRCFARVRARLASPYDEADVSLFKREFAVLRPEIEARAAEIALMRKYGDFYYGKKK